MDLMLYAFSVHNFISSVGADAGFAAIIGLAVLVLLYFAHARETANLREEASILAERLQQAEAKVAELSRPQPRSTPVPAGEGVQVTDQRSLVRAPCAPAGVGAPALAAATRVVPLSEPEPAPGVTPVPAPALAMAAAPSMAAASPAAPPPAPGPTFPTRPASPSRGPGAGGEDALLPPASAIPGPATAAGGNGRSSTMPPAAGTAPASPGAARPRPLPPLNPPASERASLGARFAIAAGVLFVLAIAVVTLVVLTSSSGSPPSTSTPRTTNAPVASRPPAFTPAAVTVAVLNGTATNQLAHRVAAKLASSGYKEGRVATAANQTESSTVVAYLPGAKNRTDAMHVATALNLKPTAVQPIDQGTQQVACPPPAACNANVVVTVGSDLATL